MTLDVSFIRRSLICMALTAFVGIAMQAQSTAPRTAAIAGVIVDDEGTPVPRALVAIMSADLPGARTVVSDDEGRFGFVQLPAGRFRLLGSKPFFVSLEFGQRSEVDLPAMIRLGSGQRLDGMQLRLPRTASIAGSIVDEHGDPWDAPRGYPLTVLAVRRGEKTRQTGARITVGDRGEFRISQLAPGTYELRVLPGHEVTVSVREGDRLTGVLIPAPSALTAPTFSRIEGTVTAPDPRALRGVQFRLESLDAGEAVDGMPVRPDRDGRFVFEKVAAGHYLLVANSAIFENPGFLSYWASADVAVDNGLPATVALTLQAGITISGRITFEAGSLAIPKDMSRVGIGLDPKDGHGAVSYAVGGNVADHTASDGAFSVRGVPPGHYTVRVFGMNNLLEGWTNESAILDGVDLLDVPLEVGRRDISGVDIRVSDRVTELSGTLREADGSATPRGIVVVFPPEPRAWFPGARKIRAVRPDTTGEFVIRGLPAGDYLVAAVSDIEPEAWFDPAQLARLRETAVPTSLGATPVRLSLAVK